MTDQAVRGRHLVTQGIATAGPVLVSVAHLSAQLVLMHRLSPNDFGVLALVLVAVQLGFGVSNALLGTPFTVTSNRTDAPQRLTSVFVTLNLGFSLVCGAAVALLAIVLSSVWVGLGFGLFTALTQLRWFGRSYAYALHRPQDAAISDFAYALAFGAALAVLLTTEATLVAVSSMFTLAALAGLLGQPRFAHLCLMVRSSGLSDYRAIWRDQSRWTLTGVISTELTANAHSWLVGLIAGPAALAPIAAAALLFRPVMLVATSLTQLERPILTRALVAGNETLAQSHVRLFRSVLAVALLVTIAGGAVILLVQPHLLIPDTYALADARLAFVLIGSSVALSVLRTPDSVVLQAMGQFRSLALASVTSGVVALAVAVVALFSLAPVFSIIGPVAGQVVLGTLIASTAKRAWANAKKDEPCQKS